MGTSTTPQSNAVRTARASTPHGGKPRQEHPEFRSSWGLEMTLLGWTDLHELSFVQ